MATCIDPMKKNERRDRNIPNEGKKCPKAIPMIPNVTAPSRRCAERKNIILSVSPQPAIPIRKAGVIKIDVKKIIGMKFF